MTVAAAIEPAETEPENPAPEASQTAEPLYPRERTFYTLDVVFDYPGKRVDVRQRIEYSNPSQSALDELVLMVEANRYPGVFSLSSLVVKGVPAADYSLEKNSLRVLLAESLLPNERIDIEIQFSLALPPIQPPAEDRRPELFGYTDRQVNLVDWYPLVAYFHPEQGWLDHPAWVYGEHQVYEAAGYRVNLQLAQAVPDLVVAASTLPVIQDGVFTYSLEAGRNFVLSASTQYLTASATVGNTVVTSYSFPFDGLAGQDALKYTVEALETYNHLFGPYPQKSLSVVEADFLDGMEFEGLFFLSKGFFNIYDGKPGSYLGAIAVHETAHQWWYSLVGNDQALEPWLDEALCTYAEYLFYEANYPEAVDWWRQVRVDYYEPEGKIDGSIRDYNGYIPYRNAVYLRGALFLHDLRQLIGDEAFFAGLQSLVSQYTYDRLITAEDFFAAFGGRSLPGIQGLLGEYFANP